MRKGFQAAISRVLLWSSAAAARYRQVRIASIDFGALLGRWISTEPGRVGDTSLVTPVAMRSHPEQRTAMNRTTALALNTLALVCLGIAVPPSAVAGQPTVLKDQIVGAWAYVSVDTVKGDGSRTPMYGDDPQGLAIFSGNGRYALMTSRAGLPKFASNNRADGTVEEYKAIVQGSISHFGTYTVNEADKTITFHIQASTFPNWNGIEQKRPVTITGDELRWTTPGASGGGNGEVVLRRAK